MAALFTPLKIKSVTLKNRLVVSPMCQYSSLDGFSGEWHLVHLGSRAIGGAGLIFTEATAVSPEGRISPSDLGIWKDKHIDHLKRITTFIETHGSVPGIQIAHAGRKSSQEAPWRGGYSIPLAKGGWETLAPSSIAYKEGEPIPKKLSKVGIEKIVTKFKKAAERALKSGFKVLELHGAHGYLIHEFLSPLSNKRNDEYGGSFENRIRFLQEIVVAVRTVWPTELPLFVRLSATEYAEGGWTEKDSIALSSILKNMDVDLIDCSTGGNVHGVKIALKPMYQTEFAENIKKETGIFTGAVGLITTAKEAESIILEKRADLVFMGREFLRDPHFPLRAAQELGHEIDWPDQYLRAKKKT
ncbi:NADH:flavin oxidoreductase/NADH oxidase [Aurantibacillus circumpalustris]|uniref:NADH:flavin oxidoreductase/NADH oxidase n=1 Tax=Aurantibacillus circumpalustris TaxID=3036359 RepID=UPI00295B674C|nr:NADH:flavin oxidoreductase/NADH oxidase [Aurantibacillus circumpalustris]